MKPLAYRSIQQLTKDLSSGQLPLTEFLLDCKKQHADWHECLQAYEQWNESILDRQASALTHSNLARQQPLFGIPFSVKSVIAVDGYDCYAGGARSLPDGFVTQGSVVTALRQAGGVVSGITHAAEFAVGGLGVNEHWPTPRNPWDALEHRVPGGSSAGAAISVWEGSSVFAIGTDTGGSVRVPASAAGLVGFKSTSGRWSTSGVVPLARRFDSLGIIAHRVSDIVGVFDLIDDLEQVGASSAEAVTSVFSGFNIRLAADLCWQGLDPGILEAINVAIDELGLAGMTLNTDHCQVHAAASALRSDDKPNTAAVECAAMLAGPLSDYRQFVGIHVSEFLASEAHRPASEVAARVAEVEQFQDTVRRQQLDNDITLAPTLRETPPTLAHVQVRENYQRYSDSLLHNTVLPSMARQCALTVPVGLDAAGMPVGMQIIAPQGCDANLLRFGLAVEKVLGNPLKRLGTPALLASQGRDADAKAKL